MDWMSKTDPIAVLYEQVDGKWVERGRTEWIKNSYSPTFATKLEMEYFFEHKQNIKVDIVRSRSEQHSITLCKLYDNTPSRSASSSTKFSAESLQKGCRKFTCDLLAIMLVPVLPIPEPKRLMIGHLSNSLTYFAQHIG